MPTLVSRTFLTTVILAFLGVMFVGAVAQAQDQAQDQAQTQAQNQAQPQPQAPSFQEQLAGWIERLEAEAVRLEGEPARATTRIGSGGSLKPGAEGERVGRLSRRLVELGLLPDDGRQTSVFGAEVEAAVRVFQASQGLRPDGIVGAQTRAGLDRTPAETAAALRRSALAMRQIHALAPVDVVLVNLPSQTVALVRKGQVQLTMRAVVGRPERETPLLNDAITHIIVNPTWTVPPTVLKADKLPILRKTGTPGIDYAAVYLDGEMVIPETVDWSAVTPNRVRIVQAPGDHNALGRFRFNLTNSQSIYLHGTNDPQVFSRDSRTVSSGCVRLEDARAMAETLLADIGVMPARIDALLATGAPQWFKLARPVPVRFVYWEATVEREGRIVLHRDIYGLVGEAAATPTI
ncbi:L,D-transpeptidase family protein [Azospirillum sp.]|uniref:L,D-transpeptidase family protein n=1 Tax=Azospirillum sp. TaxID=34012 RepID=UPI002D6C80E5|nr:L,D-transpeptidase family protein [Azospirillum sp.]HYD64534.1 L,D-transpeptidase family protein [Azospirillum sp.]